MVAVFGRFPRPRISPSTSLLRVTRQDAGCRGLVGVLVVIMICRAVLTPHAPWASARSSASMQSADVWPGSDQSWSMRYLQTGILWSPSLWPSSVRAIGRPSSLKAACRPVMRASKSSISSCWSSQVLSMSGKASTARRAFCILSLISLVAVAICCTSSGPSAAT